MKTTMIAAAAAAFGLFALTAQPAAAKVLGFTYVNGSVTSSFSLTLSLVSGDEYDVTGISGDWDGSAITGLAAIGTCCSPPNNDNLFFPNGDESLPLGFEDLTQGGIGFTTATATINLFGTDGIEYGYIVNNLGTVVFGGTLAAAAPEPAGWALMLTGFAGLGAALRSRRRILNLA